MENRIEKFKEIMNPCKDRIPPVVLDYLIDNGFFTTPASINHHGAYMGALFDHSLAVTEQLLNLTNRLGLKWDFEESPRIVGMFHDLCKMDNYQRTSSGEWGYNNEIILPGHGEKSAIMTLQLLPLSDEELYCIRWHMGAFDDKENWNSYGRAVSKYPNVLYTHTADMIASQIMGV